MGEMSEPAQRIVDEIIKLITTYGLDVVGAVNTSAFLWSTGATGESTTVSPTPGDFAYLVTETDVNSCQGTGLISVPVHSVSSPVASGPSEVCLGASVDLS